MYKKIIGDHVSGLRHWVGLGAGEDDDGVEQQPQRAGHAPAGQSNTGTGCVMSCCLSKSEYTQIALANSVKTAVHI